MVYSYNNTNEAHKHFVERNQLQNSIYDCIYKNFKNRQN